MVEQAFVEPPTEGTRVIQRRVKDVWVLGEDVLPSAHTGIGRTGVGEEAINHLGALIGRVVCLEGCNLCGRGRYPDDVEGHAAKEGEVGR